MTDTSTAIPAIERTLELKAGRDRVWRAISDPAELARWFPQRADLDLRQGGEGKFFWEGYGTFTVRIEALDPPRYLAWRGANKPDMSVEAGESTLVEWWLDERPDGGTTLRLRESGFTRPEDRAENEGGWTEELGELQALLETAA